MNNKLNGIIFKGKVYLRKDGDAKCANCDLFDECFTDEPNLCAPQPYALEYSKELTDKLNNE